RMRYEAELFRKLSEIPDEGDIERMWCSLKSAVTSSAELVCPRKRIRSNRCISDATLALVDQKRSAKACGNRTLYQYLTREVNRRLKVDEENWWNDRAQEIEEAAAFGNSAKMFSSIRRLLGSRTAVNSAMRDKNGLLLRSKEETVSRWTEYFRELYNHPDPRALDPLLSTDPAPMLDVSISDEAPGLDEIVSAINGLTVGKAPGQDGISPEMLKAGGIPLAQKLEPLVVKIWTDERMPQDWKDSIVVPTYKKKDRTECSNYRGISLLSMAAKVLMSIIRRRIANHRELRTREEQAGFRKGRGCIDHIFALRQLLEMRKRHGKPWLVVFIDFAAAFDSVHRASLWQALLHDGFPRKVVNILQEYYGDANSRVRVYGEMGEPFEITTGVRQGCIMSPSLFNIIIDWVMHQAMTGIPKLSGFDGFEVADLEYADDIAALADSEAAGQLILDRIDQAASKLGLNISGPKTKAVSSGLAPVTLNLHGSKLEVVDDFTYLGAKITESGTSSDVAARIGKATGVFARLKVPLWSHQRISIKTKMRVYNACVLPTALYACETWTLLKDDINKLEVFQMRCLRQILGVSLLQRINNTVIRARCCGMPTVEAKIRKSRLRWFGHACRMAPHRLPYRAITSTKPPGWKVPRTAPKKRWVDQVTNDMSHLDFTSLSEAIAVAGNRQAWREIVRDLDGFEAPTSGHRAPHARCRR
ncbi:MAG: reverse transcriptase family protein, partial [Cyanobacteria bacterium P01_G01_bin.4]